jgi:tetratricopeptide (TPR) repeat protein
VRARIYAKSGQMDLAAKDMEAIRKVAGGNGQALNNLCWLQAGLGVFLDAALADCDAALAAAPGQPAFMDSRAFVLLRMGRVDEAIALYDAVLAKEPRIAASLYGRGVAKARKGLKEESEKDLAAARKISTGVDKTFEGYGVKP